MPLQQHLLQFNQILLPGLGRHRPAHPCGRPKRRSGRNATIEAWSVETESLADEVENKEARAQEIIDELDNVQPDQWTPPTQVDLSYGDLTDLYNDSQPSGVYPRPTPKATWGSRDGRTPTI